MMSESSRDQRPDCVPAASDNPPPLALRSQAPAPSVSLLGDDLFAAPAAQAVAGGGQISHMLLRGKWIIIAVFLFVSAVSIPPIWIIVKPHYESTAVVQIDPTSMMIAFRTEDNASTTFYQSYVNTQVSTIRSPEVLNRVLDQESIRKTFWYTDEGRSLTGSTLPPLERLREDLKVQTRPQTKLIQVSISTRKAADARLIVNTVVDKYITYVEEMERKAGADRIDTLRTENSDRQRRINDLRETQFTLSRRFGALDLNQLRSQLSTDIHRLETERAEAKRLLDIAEWQLEQMGTVASRPAGLEGGDPAATRPAPTSMPVYVVDAEWRRFNLDVRTARHALELAQKKFGDPHPKLADLKDQLEFAERILREREAQLDAQGIHSAAFAEGVGPAVAAPSSRVELTRQVQQQQRMLALLDADLEKQRATMDDVGNVAQQIAVVDEQIRQNQATNDEVRRRIEVLEVESKAPARIQVASYGIEPTRPDKDRRMLLTAMALAAAAMAGVALTYLRGTLDTRIAGVSDVKSASQVPFLGHLRHLSRGVDPLDAEDRLFNESVRMIRTSLLQRLGDIQAPVVLITSPLPQCGKTTISVLLAKSLATLEKRVLLVETDFRHSSFGDYLHIEARLGLAEILAGKATDEQAIARTLDIGIHVLPAGSKTPLSALEYLANGQFAACLKRWRKMYDYVLLDAPPVLPVADARILAAHADGTVMVLRSSRCRRADALESYACLGASGGSLLGTVLIGGEPLVASGYGYGYDYYSSRPTTES